MTTLFETWTSARSLWAAALRAARGKRRRASVARVLFELEGTVVRLEAMLRDGSWQPGRTQSRIVRDGKERLIQIAPFEDRIVHQALCAAVGPLLDRHLIAESYACRIGRGTHAALRRAVAWARHYRFVVHLDVRKLFPSIDHAILLGQLARDVGCSRTLGVCARILQAGLDGLIPARFHFPGDDLFSPVERPIGLPIGSLTSQHFANRYLSPVDHRARDRLRVRGYLRYMDDMLLFGDDRAQLCAQARDVEQACERLRLRLHRWQPQPTRAGLGFLGFVICPDHVRVRRSSVRRGKTKLARRLAEGDVPRFCASLRALFAHWAHADSWRLREATLRELGVLHEPARGDDDAQAPPNGAPQTTSLALPDRPLPAESPAKTVRE